MVQAADGSRPAHRGRLDIIANILNSAVAGVRKTAIMYSCNLSFKQLEIYLHFLLGKGLIRAFTRRESAASRFYETTERGMDYLRAYHNLDALISM